MGRFMWLSVVAVACAGAFGCVELEDGAEPALESAEQELSQTFVIRSVSVPSQVVDVLFAQNGALVRIVPASITSQQRWLFDGTRLHYNNQPGLCLAPTSAATGSTLVLRPCSTDPNALQDWAGLLLSNGTVAFGNRATNLYLDASAGAFGVLRAQPLTRQPPQQFRLE